MSRNYTINVADFMQKNLEVTVYGEGKPEVLITGGIHGGEATGIYAANKLMNYLDEHNLIKGSVKVLAVANPTAFRRMERTSPYDNKDMNRIFPGDRNGTISERVAAAIWQESQSADYIVDLHCCGVYGYSYTLAVWQDYDNAKELASMLDIPIIVQSGGTPGQLFVDTCKQGRPAVIIELPGGGQGGVIAKAAGDQAFKALVNMLAQLDMVDADATKPSPQWCDKLIAIRVNAEGLFIPKVAAGEVVEKERVIGTVNGEAITAPATGTLTGMRPMSYVFRGDYLGRLAPHIMD